MWEITFAFSGGGKSVLVIDSADFAAFVDNAKKAAAFFCQELVEIHIYILEDE